MVIFHSYVKLPEGIHIKIPEAPETVQLAGVVFGG